MTPAIHIEAMYSTTPMVEVQKCTSISLTLYICVRLNSRGIREYIVPMVIIATQPSAPECTCPMIQSV